MPDDAISTEDLLAQLTFAWLQARTGAEPGDVNAAQLGIWNARLVGKDVAVTVESVSSAPLAPGWPTRLQKVAGRLHVPVPGAALVWIPVGAEVPDREPAASAAAEALNAALAALEPGTAGDAHLPIELSIRKRDENGAYVSAFGGLSAHWARFTDRVSGYFQIDSTDLHRLPADISVTTELVDRLVEASKGLALDETVAVQAHDYWRVQRLNSGSGVAVIATSPDDGSENGAPLRKRLRQVLPAARERLAGVPTDVRVLALYAHLPSLVDEPVGAALRGQDPTLFGGLDLVVLLADGQVRPLIDITRKFSFQPA